MPDTQGEITRLLVELRDGHRDAMDRLVPLVYDNLRALAHHHLQQRASGHTLDATALVHDAFVRLVDRTRFPWEDRQHFFAVYSRVMRNLIVDHARARSAQKRGGDRARVTLHENAAAVEQHADEILAIEDALERIATVDERLARVVECRYFAGLTEAETAETLATSERTVRRDWRKARALLREILAD